MATLIPTLIVGGFLIVIGCINWTGNVLSLHWYHRQRVTEEDRKPFGRMVGLGNILIGAGIILYGILFYFFELTGAMPLLVIGLTILFASLTVGLILSFRAMIRYNKGIF